MAERRSVEQSQPANNARGLLRKVRSKDHSRLFTKRPEKHSTRSVETTTSTLTVYWKPLRVPFVNCPIDNGLTNAIFKLIAYGGQYSCKRDTELTSLY